MFHIFQNIPKCSIHSLRPFKYKNMGELCDKKLDKDKKGRLMAKKGFVLHEEVIDVFHEKYYIPTIEKVSFHLAHVRILGSMEYGKTRNDCFHGNTLKILNFFKILCRKMQQNKRYINDGVQPKTSPFYTDDLI